MQVNQYPGDGTSRCLPIDGRDNGGDRFTNTVGAMVLHVPGVTDRDAVEQHAHSVADRMPRPLHPLCGVRHVEDIGVWQAPYTGRDELRREVARLGQEHQRPVVIVHGYQHVGPCPTEDEVSGG